MITLPAVPLICMATIVQSGVKYNDTSNFAGIVPFDDLSMLGFESVSLLEDFGAGISPTFTIVSSSRYIRDINSANSSSARNSTLPPSFLISLSYKPQNNTALKFFSSHVKAATQSKINSLYKPVAQNSLLVSTSRNNNPFISPFETNNLEEGSASEPSNGVEPELGSGSGEFPTLIDKNEDDDPFTSLLLSSTATYLQENSFLDLWTNITGSKEHNLVFMVVNGTISSCLDGEFKLGEAQVTLWNANNSFDQESEEGTDETVEIKFSDALHAVQSVVSSCSRHVRVCEPGCLIWF